MICKLALEDGTVLTGHSVGAVGTRTGEVVFNTAMSGYQEVITDPSYCGQIVTMTFPLMGNYGVNGEDMESSRPALSGFVVKELPRRPSNHRATEPLASYFEKNGIVGLAGVDTRALTRRVRIHGALRGVISTEITDDLRLIETARQAPVMSGCNLTRQVASQTAQRWAESDRDRPASLTSNERQRSLRVVAIDCGIKQNILRCLAEVATNVTVVPGSARAEDILALEPDGVLVGNGPGDPAAVSDTVDTLRELIGRVPVFGICLGHQLLALALGARTFKLRFGHHGANHPVLNKATGRVEITSQNHGFAVDPDSLSTAGLHATHVNLYDGSLEGYVHDRLPVMGIQYHPEAAPGPHDSRYLFDLFARMMWINRAGGPSATNVKSPLKTNPVTG